MSNEHRRLELLRNLKQDGIVNAGRIQVATGDYIIKDANKMLKVDKLLKLAFPNGKLKLLLKQLDCIFLKDKYYLFFDYNIQIDEKTGGIIQYDSANDMASIIIKFWDEFDNLLGGEPILT